MTEHVRLTRHGSVLEISFARPEKKNALSNAMYLAAREALAAARADDGVRVVLFSADGDAFTAGNDLADFANAANAEPQAGKFIDAITRFEKPLVAAVQGLAVGVGTTMLLHCDLVYVAEEAKLTAPFVNLALVPEAGSSLLLPARIGHVNAFAMFALGEAVTGMRAVELGLANRALPRDQVRVAALEAATTLATKPAGALLATKRLMRGLPALLAHMEEEGAAFAAQLRSTEARAFFESFAKRKG